MNLFAPCPRGLEQLLAAELAVLGGANCRAVAGGVAFTGDRRVAYAANLHSRLASRVLAALGARRYRDESDLYRLASGIEWERHFDARHTLRVDTSAIRSPLRSLNFATLRVKDGIVDRLRERTGERPSIDTRDPDARVWLFLEARNATLYLDLSGEPLFKRGWRAARDDHGEAPLKENMAAGLLMLAGWTPAAPLVDPFCGSGTIAIEAACVARDRAPGLGRAFGLEKLLDHDSALWAALRDEALDRARSGAGAPLQIAASDIDPLSVESARRNLERAGLPGGEVRWSVADLAHAVPPFRTPGLVVANPPYGKRLEAYRDDEDRDSDHNEDRIEQEHGAPRRARAAERAGARPTNERPTNERRTDERRTDERRTEEHRTDERHAAAMRAIGDSLRRSWTGWQVWMLSADPELPHQLRMKERRRTPLYNGAIECRLFCFDVFPPARASLNAPVSASPTDAAPSPPASPNPTGSTARRTE